MGSVRGARALSRRDLPIFYCGRWVKSRCVLVIILGGARVVVDQVYVKNIVSERNSPLPSWHKFSGKNDRGVNSPPSCSLIPATWTLVGQGLNCHVGLRKASGFRGIFVGRSTQHADLEPRLTAGHYRDQGYRQITQPSIFLEELVLGRVPGPCANDHPRRIEIIRQLPSIMHAKY